MTFRPKSQTVALAAVLSVAVILRVWLLLTHTYVLFPDETFQYLEPGYRLAFGNGIVPWEYIDGIRSWLLPGVIAGIMRVAALVDRSPDFYVGAVRFACVLVSLIVPYVGFRLGERAGGLAGGIVAGLVGACWYELLYFAPVVMTEPLAAHLAILALWLGEPGAVQRRPVLAGVLLGLAACLRYQYAPALGVAALWQYRRDGAALAALCAAGIGCVAVCAGLLDWFTWGQPFQSIWFNFQRNALQHVGAAMGTEPWWFTAGYFVAAWQWLAPLLLGLAVYGAGRAPGLAIAAAVTLVLHSLSPHKELRFIYLAIAIAPLLIGTGAARLLAAAAARRGAGIGIVIPAATLAGLLLVAAEAQSALSRATPEDAWHRGRSILQAFAVARDVPGVCGIGVRALHVFRSGGYTYLDRSVPLYFESFDTSQHLLESSFRMRIRVVLGGAVVPQPHDLDFPDFAARFNVLIGFPDSGLPGFARRQCIGTGAAGDPPMCVFVRPGGCG